MGDRLVAYGLRWADSGLEYGFVFDLASGVGMATASAALASRDKLLWREESGYLVAPVLTA